MERHATVAPINSNDSTVTLTGLGCVTARETDAFSPISKSEITFEVVLPS